MELSADAIAQIEKLTKQSNIVAFVKCEGERPTCKFSKKLVHLLLQQGVHFSIVNVKKINSENIEFYNQIKQYSNFPTFPQLYIAGKFIGGVDIVQEMIENGEFLETIHKLTPESVSNLSNQNKTILIRLQSGKLVHFTVSDWEQQTMRDVFQFVFDERIKESEEKKPIQKNLKQFYLTHFYPNTPIHFDKSCFNILIKDTEIIFDENQQAILMVIEVDEELPVVENSNSATKSIPFSTISQTLNRSTKLALDWLPERRNILLFTIASAAAFLLAANLKNKK